ncbi:hypothetical protein CIJ63_07710 [Neisseria meningitidis]|nr:hypothetical protein A6L49_10700 [Neisseria meningitidis]ANX23730.1 hypothetical protein A6L47_05440 [Neisseria meningitidis]ANX38823.1 hypothetical protein A6L48_08635 [Neisseria meningitidis]ANX50055.1 hypothetical protein A6L46_01250 [Neisseria meningitidis]ANX73674.1 hypothetical protein A6L42_05690 [Neisseria meningitidis]
MKFVAKCHPETSVCATRRNLFQGFVNGGCTLIPVKPNIILSIGDLL